MGAYEPEDSRIITQKKSSLPIEPERTGPRENEARKSAKKAENTKGKDK